MKKFSEKQSLQNDRATLVDICQDIGSWAPIPRLKTIADRHGISTDFIKKSHWSSYKGDICEYLRTQLSAQEKRFALINNHAEADFVRHKFLPLILADRKQYDALRSRERKIHPDVPLLSQRDLLERWNELFGFPLTSYFDLNTNYEAERKVKELQKGSEPCTDTAPCNYIFDPRDGSISLNDGKKTKQLAKPILDTGETSNKPMQTHTLEKAEMMRNIYRDVYQAYIKKQLEHAKSATCRQIYGSAIRFNPLYIRAPIVHHGKEGFVYDHASTICKNNSCIVKRLTGSKEVGKKIAMIATALRKTNAIPEIHGVWICDHQNAFQYSESAPDEAIYILMDKINGISLEIWLEIHSGDTKRIEKVMHRLLTKIKILHSKGIVHGDLHDQNVLVDSKDIPHIIDIGKYSFFGKRPSDFILDLESIPTRVTALFPEWLEYEKELSSRK